MKEKIETLRTTTLELTREDIVELLNRWGYEITDHTTVSFEIPSGGNWSNMALNISAQHPIHVTWQNKL